MRTFILLFPSHDRKKAIKKSSNWLGFISVCFISTIGVDEGLTGGTINSINNKIKVLMIRNF